MLLLERINQVQTFVHFIQTFGVELYFILLTRHFLRNILQLDISAFHAFGKFPGNRINPLQAEHRVQAFLQPGQQASFVRVERLPYPIESGLYLFRMAQRICLLLQLLLLTGRQVCLFQLFQLETDIVFVRLILIGTGNKGLQILLCLLPCSEDMLVSRQGLFVMRQDVQYIQLKSFLVQQ